MVASSEPEESIAVDEDAVRILARTRLELRPDLYRSDVELAAKALVEGAASDARRAGFAAKVEADGSVVVRLGPQIRATVRVEGESRIAYIGGHSDEGGDAPVARVSLEYDPMASRLTGTTADNGKAATAGEPAKKQSARVAVATALAHMYRSLLGMGGRGAPFNG